MDDLFDLLEDRARSKAGEDVPGMEVPAGLQEATSLPAIDDWNAPGPIADAFFWSDADVIAIRGPVGSGKTTAHLRSRFRRAVMMPRSVIDGVRRYKVVIARETYRQLWSTTIPSWWEVVPKKMGVWSGGRGDPVTHKITFTDDWGPVEFIAEFMAFGSSPAEVEANIRGVQTTDLALEEADTVPVAVFTKGVGRIDRYPNPSHFEGYADEDKSYGQVSCSYNSTDEDNWTVRTLEGGEGDGEGAGIRETLEAEGVRIEFFRQPGFDEPGCENLQNLSAKYYPRQIAVMRAEGRNNDIKRLVYNQNAFIRIGDPVFADSYVPNIHRSRQPLTPIPGLGLRIGLDQGQFGAAVIGQFVQPFQWRIYAELVFEQSMFADKFGLKLRELLDTRFRDFRVEEAFCDMAGNANESLEDHTWINTVSEASKLSIQPQMLGGNRIAPRLAVWNAAMNWNFMGNQGLIVDPSCRVLLRGLENDYVWTQEVDKAENRKRVPKKKGIRAADVIDAGGYMMLGESLPDGRPKTADLVGHNGGPPLDDQWSQGAGMVEENIYDFQENDW